MASLSDVSRYLRQRRAVGKPITAADRSAAWNAYFDTEASKSLSRSRLALDSRRVDITEKSAADNLALNKDRLAMEQEAYEDAGDAAKVQGLTQLGTLGYMAYDKIGGKAVSGLGKLFGGGTSTAPVSTMGVSGAAIPAADAAALSSVGAQGAAVSNLAPASTMGVSGASIPVTDAAALSSTTGAGGGMGSAGGGMGAAGIGGLALGIAADDIASRYLSGTMDDPAKSWEQKTKGVLRYGGLSPFMTSLVDRSLGKSGQEMLNKLTDPFGHMQKLEEKVGGAVSASLPKFLGGGGSTGSSLVDTILNPLGTWLCTETKKFVGFSIDEWKEISNFRKYAEQYHPDWLEWYVDIGPDLVKAIDGDKEFYENLKQTFLLPMVNLSKGGHYEAVCLAYISVVEQLVEEYQLMEVA